MRDRAASPTAHRWRPRSWSGCCATTRPRAFSGTSTRDTTWPPTSRRSAGSGCPCRSGRDPPGGRSGHFGRPERAGSTFDRMGADLALIGQDRSTGGYRRYAWTAVDATLREWFRGEAAQRGLEVVADRAGNLWAWTADPDAGDPGLVLGSHLDSVPDGGAFDGPLGIVSAFAALDRLDRSALRRPVGIACFADEEGARFGVACAGSRLLTGVLDPDRARALTDDDGATMAEAMSAAGVDPHGLGRDEETLRRIGTFVELHVEQGRALADGSA